MNECDYCGQGTAIGLDGGLVCFRCGKIKRLTPQERYKNNMKVHYMKMKLNAERASLTKSDPSATMPAASREAAELRR